MGSSIFIYQRECDNFIDRVTRFECLLGPTLAKLPSLFWQKKIVQLEKLSYFQCFEMIVFFRMNLEEFVDLSVEEVNEIFKDYPPERIRAVKRKRTILRNRKHAGKIRFWFSVQKLSRYHTIWCNHLDPNSVDIFGALFMLSILILYESYWMPKRGSQRCQQYLNIRD